MAKTDLERAFDALKAKNKPYTTLWDYFDGNQPLVYSNKRLREVFDGIDARFSQNWCEVVINAALDKISLQRFQVGEDETTSESLNDLFVDTQLNLDAHEVHTAALVTGESFVIVGEYEKGVEAYYNDPRLCHVFYDPDHPRVKEFAAKWWVDQDEKRRINLYYTDRIEHYVSRNKAANLTTGKPSNFSEPETEENHIDGVIPVFHFLRERRVVKSEIGSVIELQDAVNKLLSDMMVAAEFGAFKQRYVISNADTANLKNAPNEIWSIPAGDGQGQQASAGQFDATDLDNYLAAIDKLATSIAIITRTPKHYVFAQGGDPSGEALIAMESPLNSKATKYIERFSVVWQEIAGYLMTLRGQTIPVQDIKPIFSKPETVQPLTQAQIRQTNVSAGIPLKTQLRDEGWSDAQFDAMDKDSGEAEAKELSKQDKSAEIAAKHAPKGQPFKK